MKKSKDFKTVVILLSVAAAIVLIYVIQGVYFSYSGKVITEYIFETSEKQVVPVDSFAVRDENRTGSKKNISILTKSDNRVYVPAVSDSESVAKNQTIALSFKNEAEAQAYNKSVELQDKIDHLEQLQDQGNLSHINVVTLNSEIASAVGNYMKLIDSGNYTGIDDAVRNLSYKITTRQIATGTKLDFSSIISEYSKERKRLLKSIGSKKAVSTKYAGYFVSNVDGYESVCDYQSIANGEIDNTQIEKLLKSKSSKSKGAFGKIIGQHTWYLLCNIPLTEASSVKTGYYVKVSFPERGIYDLDMSVHSVSGRAGDTVGVILKCTSMNEALSSLRKEKAQITVKTYNGLRISNDALVKDEKSGQQGVYTVSGNRVVFKPIEIIYYGENYVIAIPPANNKNENGESSVALGSEIKAFDRVIVKGRNLSDGKLIS